MDENQKSEIAGENRVFDVNGYTDEGLAATLRLACQLGGFKIQSMTKHRTKGLVLYWSDQGVCRLPCSLDADGAFPLVKGYLESKEAKEIECKGRDADLKHDGHNRRGWRVCSDNSDPDSSSRGAFVSIRPAYIWFGK